MQAKEAEWYNEVLPDCWGIVPLDESPALPTYEAAASLLWTGRPVVDLGCGTGRFAELLHRRGFTEYVGFDFAEDVVAEAERYCTAPGFEFYVDDLRYMIFHTGRPVNYVLLEVLEHLDDDLGLLRRLPASASVVFSVPTFESESHVRTFPEVHDAVSRYDDLLFFQRHQVISFPTSDNQVYVYRAYRRDR